MTREPSTESATRNWRDIPQPIKPRAMSRGGRWRLTLAILRGMLAAVVVGFVGWVGWKVVGTLQEDSGAMPAAAKAVPLRRPELITSTGGVLTSEWLARILALPNRISLMEVNLKKIEARVLAENQVLSAKVDRKAPDRLIVEIAERMPIAKVMADWQGRQQPLLVARDGVVFAGEGYAPATVESLPWLAGINLVRRDNAFRPVDGMDLVDELLVKAQTDAAHLYASWRIVSLERLFTDRELEVTTADGCRIVFGVGGPRMSEFMRRASLVDQLARLDAVWEKAGHLGLGFVDLSLSAEKVLVRLHPPAAADAAATAAQGATPASVSFLSRPLLQLNREL